MALRTTGRPAGERGTDRRLLNGKQALLYIRGRDEFSGTIVKKVFFSGKTKHMS